MLTLKMLCVGRPGEKWLETGIEMYLARMCSTLKTVQIWAKDDNQLLKAIANERHAIALDPAGMELTSEQFSRFIHEQFVQGGSQLTLIVGGAAGLPKGIREGGFPLVSLSKMVLPHHIARLVFIEQLYRAFEILKGTSYHK